MQPDPIGFDGDATNLYRYCENNAPNYIDPNGEFVPLIAAIVLAVFTSAYIYEATHMHVDVPPPPSQTTGPPEIRAAPAVQDAYGHDVTSPDDTREENEDIYDPALMRDGRRDNNTEEAEQLEFDFDWTSSRPTTGAGISGYGVTHSGEPFTLPAQGGWVAGAGSAPWDAGAPPPGFVIDYAPSPGSGIPFPSVVGQLMPAFSPSGAFSFNMPDVGIDCVEALHLLIQPRGR